MPYDLTPEQERAMREMYLWGFEQPGAFGMPMGMQTDPYAMGGVFMEPGSMRGSEVKNYMQLMSDPAFIAQLGAGPGGPRPESFDPITSFEPVRQPGREMLQYAIESGDPIYQLMAEVIMNDGTSFEAEQVIRDILADPENPWFEQVSARMPQYQDQITEDFLPDWRRISTIAQSLMEDSISDPMGDMVDPNTGMAMNVSEEMSPAAEYFRRAGLPLPTERYGMEQWRSPDEMAAFAENQQMLPQAQQQMRADQSQFELLRNRAALPQGRETVSVAPQIGASRSVGLDRPWMQHLIPSGGAGQPTAGAFDLSNEFPHLRSDLPAHGPEWLPPETRPANVQAPGGGGTRTRPVNGMWDQIAERSGLGPRPEQDQVRGAGRQALRSFYEEQERRLGYGRGEGGQINERDRRMQQGWDRSGRTPLNDTLAARREAMLRFGLQY